MPELTGGVHSATVVVKAMMAGAKVAVMTSALLKTGINHLSIRDCSAAVLYGNIKPDRRVEGVECT